MSAPKKLIPYVIIAAVAVFIVYHFLPSGPSPGNQTATGQYSPASSYALRAENSWPPLGEEAESAQVADDLLASNYFVVLDGSGSMAEVGCSAGQPKIDAARTALESFAQSLPPNANLGLAVFAKQGIKELLPLGLDNREQFAEAVQGVIAGSGTPLRSAIDLAYDRLLAQGRGQLGYGDYHLVVVTDGRASGGQEPTAKVNAMLAESPVVLHTIGFCIGEDHSLNQRGRTYYRAADNPAALRKGLDEVLAEAPTFDLTEFRD